MIKKMKEIMILKNKHKTKHKKIIFVGLVRTGQPAICGETMKNQLITEQLRKYNYDVCIMDFFGWRQRPWIIVNLLLKLLFYPRVPLILSSSSQNIFPVIKLMYFTKSKRVIIFWVVGGDFHTKVAMGVHKIKHVNYITANIVQSDTMALELKKYGVNNAIYVPNSKPIKYIPQKQSRSSTNIRFVFLSRILPEKGCNLIIEAINQLNTDGFINEYSVDFYGKIDDAYYQEFTSKLGMLENANYKGFLKLREYAEYDEFSKYDVMLFPTFWKSEGFAGVFIDAFIAGLPIIVSDWNHNKEFIKDGKTGIVISPQNVSELAIAMRSVIEKKIDITKMSKNCQAEAMNYDIDKVITKELLEKIGL